MVCGAGPENALHINGLSARPGPDLAMTKNLSQGPKGYRACRSACAKVCFAPMRLDALRARPAVNAEGVLVNDKKDR